METNNNQNPKVSIIVPLYNQERFIGSCLNSVCKQTYKNLEVVIVNDGSTDKSVSIARTWAEKDKRIRIIDKKNEGATEARRDGLLKSSGEYVAFVDSDDLLPRYAIEHLVDCMEGTDIDLAFGSVIKKLGPIKRCHIDEIYSFPYRQAVSQPELFEKYYLGFFSNKIFPVSMWGRLYRKAAINKALSETDLFDKDVNRMGEDQYFNLMLFPYLRSMYRTEESVYIYRYGGGTTRFNPHFPQLFTSSDKRLSMLDKYQYTSGYEPLFKEYIACIYFYASQLIFDNRADKEGVIDFFRKEAEDREVAWRLNDYYIRNKPDTIPIRLFLERNYEKMYEFSLNQSNQLFGSAAFRMKKMLLKLVELYFKNN